MSVLPSKKVGGALLFVFALIVLVSFFPERPEHKESEKISASNNRNAEKVIAKDSDSDGLADWEEALWNTDPQNPDTDGDGTSDGDEVRLRRDPTKSGDDSLANSARSQSALSSIVSEGENLTLTEKFGRELFAVYAHFTNSNYFSGDKSDVLYNVLDQDVSGLEEPELYKLLDIKTSGGSLEAIRNYGNSLAINFREGAFREGAEINEVKIIASLLENNTAKDIRDLEEVISINKTILKKNLNLPAPLGAEKLHLALINSHKKVIGSLEKILLLKKDSILAVLGIGEYESATNDFGNVLEDFRQYFYVKGIKFNQSEPGIVFNKRF